MGRGRDRDNGRADLREVFLAVQEQMLANLAASKVFEHSTACGTASERHWIDLLNHHLPQRYRASNAFLIDADGRRSRQIDIAIYDHFYAPRWFHDRSQPYIPAESVYAVFEVKQSLSSTVFHDASRKARSVRRLRRTSAGVPSVGGQYVPQASPILAGILTTAGRVGEGGSEGLLSFMAEKLGEEERLDLGCCLGEVAFEIVGELIEVSRADEALIFFMLRLMERLQQMGPSPAVDFGAYGGCLK